MTIPQNRKFLLPIVYSENQMVQEFIGRLKGAKVQYAIQDTLRKTEAVLSSLSVGEGLSALMLTTIALPLIGAYNLNNKTMMILSKTYFPPLGKDHSPQNLTRESIVEQHELFISTINTMKEELMILKADQIVQKFKKTHT